jgi:uncharacterized protein (TIGR02118 family)
MVERLPGVVRMGMIRRLPTLSRAEFSDHWKGPHGTIASRIPNLRRYHQNHATERLAIGRLPDRWSLDGLSQLWFDDIETMMRSIGSPQYAPLARDTPTVMTMPGLIAGFREVVVKGAEDKSGLVKAMSVIGRNPDRSASSFASLWRERANRLTQIPHLRSAANIFIEHWESEPGKTVPYDDLPVDVVCELWFTSEDHMRSAFQSELAGLLGPRPEALAAYASSYGMKTFVIVA